MPRAVIIGGAEIRDYARALEFIKEDDFLIYCDSGLSHEKGLGKKPDLIIGDFDSHENPESETETIVLPHIKDDTDTVFAVKEVIKRGFDSCLLLGAAGGRLDHTAGNISALLMLENAGVKAILADDYSEMEILGSEEKSIDNSYPYFSLLSLFGEAKGVNISGALYPLTDAAISPDYQYGISNEVLPGETAKVSVKSGKLLLVKIAKE